jgi:hypothetical protein
VDLPREAADLVTGISDQGLPARLLGGVAVAIRCPTASAGPLRRSYHDLDLMVTSRAAYRLGQALEAAGYRGEERFNALHGRSRMMFSGPLGHIDVLVGQFVMCHRLEVGARLTIDALTLSLADLLLTKLQIAQLNAKDASDIAAILLDHRLAGDESGINRDRVTGVLGGDWGWWRTVTGNLEWLSSFPPELLDGPARTTLGERIRELRAAIDARPKSVKWKVRASFGERMPWRLEPEEV